MIEYAGNKRPVGLVLARTIPAPAPQYSTDPKTVRASTHPTPRTDKAGVRWTPDRRGWRFGPQIAKGPSSFPERQGTGGIVSPAHNARGNGLGLARPAPSQALPLPPVGRGQGRGDLARGP